MCSSDLQTMIEESKSSTNDLNDLLISFRTNLPGIINTTTIVLILFFLWLLATQVVILSQGYELYHGTATKFASTQEDELVDKSIENVEGKNEEDLVSDLSDENENN